jgi:acyl-CoA synthetase (AMP-forming)/AMP-acid ligase II
MALDVIRAYGTDPEKRDTLAIIEDCGRTLTWRELLSWRNKLVQVLCGTLSLSPGERVVIYAHNAIEYVVMTAALTAAGLIAIPMNWRLVPEEVAFICNDSQARAVFYGREFSPTIQRLVAERSTSVVHWVCLSEDAAVPSLPLLLQQAADIMPEIREFSGQMLYTGGTTGKPKGAFRLKGRDPAITREILQAVDMIYADHTHLACGPLYHSAPAIFAFFCQQIGGLLVIMRKFQPERALQLMVQHRVTSTFMAPTLLKMIAMLPPSTLAKYAPLVQLRNIIVAAAHCPQSLKEFIVHTFGPCLYEMYGSTELGFNTVLRPEGMSFSLFFLLYLHTHT